ncbi:dipeptide ABC transporter ATP-binding protein [Microbacterium insulae]|uniref:Dipeptide ABC transporter ATP-binding protein n=1 Tax=Microbacterium insulae TaxID=483014 RepID=A0ABW3AIG4_9MICO
MIDGNPQTGAPRVRVDGLGIVLSRSRTPVVEDVSFSVGPAKVMGLVGESGSGKSTVALSLLGYARRGLTIASGTVDIAGTSVLDLSGTALRRARGTLVSYVPQDPASGLNPALTLGFQLSEAMRVHDDGTATDSMDVRVAALLDDVRLHATAELLGSYPHQVSGGQAQRIAIAMAFACRPRLVVLDEPTTGLDVTTQRHVLETIRRLATTHDTSAVYVSHDLPVVAEIADDVAVMYAGRLVEHAPARVVFGGARHPYTAGLLRAAPTPERAGVLVGIEGRPPRPGRWPSGCAFADRCPRVTPECREAVPALALVGPDHVARCIHPVERTESPAPIALVTPRPVAAAASAGDLELNGLDAWYGAKKALHGVKFTVASGTCVGVVGESGSGKTTLARCLAGLHPSWGGPVAFDGTSLDPRVQRRSLDQRRRIQYIFQNPHASLNPRLTVGENIEVPLQYFEHLNRIDRRRKVAEVLDQVALGADLANRMPEQLSGGERQRVAVARALIVDPELLICDEITSALDVSVQALVIEQLRELQRERGLTMVFITHNVAVVRSIAQDVVVLEQGRVVEAGPTEMVLNRPEHPYTQQLMRDLPRFADAVA